MMSTTTLEKIKANLIVRISKLDREESVRKIEKVVSLIENNHTERQIEMLHKVARPIRKKLDLHELIREQDWKPINRKEFERLVKEIDIQESVEQLIADIGK